MRRATPQSTWKLERMVAMFLSEGSVAIWTWGGPMGTFPHLFISFHLRGGYCSCTLGGDASMQVTRPQPTEAKGDSSHWHDI